jgi:hypothetical protein
MPSGVLIYINNGCGKFRYSLNQLLHNDRGRAHRQFPAWGRIEIAHGLSSRDVELRMRMPAI